MERLPDSLMNLSAAFLLELGNTISSLFGGGTSSDAKENGTDAVQVRAERQTIKWLGLGDVDRGRVWRDSQLPGLYPSSVAGCPAPASVDLSHYQNPGLLVFITTCPPFVLLYLESQQPMCLPVSSA